MRRIVLALALASLGALAGCASHEKLGDRAAAVGDWKSAEAQYAEALKKDPGNAERRAKWQQARAQALQGAVAKARACLASQDWECAFVESDYALYLEPGSAEYASMRADAGRNFAYLRLRQAADAGQRRDHRAAFSLLQGARDASNDPGVQKEAARIQPTIVSGAVRDAMVFRGQQQYPQAIDLLAMAAAVDGSVRPKLEQVRGEYDRWLDQQYEAAAQQGDALLRDRRFAEAQGQYEAALKFKKGGRAEPLARYARALGQGDAAVQRRDWPAATSLYGEAVSTGMDRSGYGASQLERVRLRPVAIRVGAVLVRPFRPDGSPWAGPRSHGFDRLVGKLANRAFDRADQSDRAALRDAVEAYDSLPFENRPNLFATLTLPDGRQFVTPPHKALRARFDASVVVESNYFDDRPIAIQIAHAAEGGVVVEIGGATVRIAELLNGGEIAIRDRALLEMRVLAEMSPHRDGTAEGFALVVPPPQPAAYAPPPRR